MPASSDELRKFSKEEEKDFESLCEEIDTKLKEEWQDDYDEVEVPVSKSFKRKVSLKILRIYRDLGWDVIILTGHQGHDCF